MALRKMSLTLTDLPENFLKHKLNHLSANNPTTNQRRLSNSSLLNVETKKVFDKVDDKHLDVSNTPVPLAFLSYCDKSETHKNQKSPLIIHHNLIGSKENWKTACKEMYHVTKRSVFSVDARNHGESPHTLEMNCSAMAKDVECFVEHMEASKVSFVGHSFGGKIGLLLAMLRPELLEKIVIIDSSPFVNKNSLKKWDLVREASCALKEVEEQLKKLSGVERKTFADKIVEKIISNKCDRALFLSNLLTTNENDDKLWRLNLEALLSNPDLMSDYSDLFFGIDGHYDGPILFVSGEKSQNIRKIDEDSIKTFFPNAKFIWMANTGQWLHVEKHAELMNKVVSYLESD